MEQEQQKPWLSGRRRNLVGVLLIILPFITLAGVIFLYAITSFIIDSVVGASVAHAQEFTDLDAQRVLDDPMYQSGIAPEIPISAYQGMEEEFDGFGTMNTLTAESGGLEEVSLATVIGSLIRIVLSLIGIVALLMIPIGGIAGVYLLVTNKE